MKSTDLVLEDWKITNDRIRHLDNSVIRLRIEGIPIATTIIAAGLVSYQYTKNLIVPQLGWPVAMFVVLFGSLYLIPVFLLDLLYYRLLLISVNHARDIERMPRYRGKLQITTKLTSPRLTLLHTVCAVLIYLSIIVGGFIVSILME